MQSIGIVMLKLDGKRVYLACGVTDMRKAINGLTALVEQSFNLDPFDEAVFVFCNRNRNRLKIILWDGDGFWLLFKRLEKGRFRWSTKEGESTMTLTGGGVADIDRRSKSGTQAETERGE